MNQIGIRERIAVKRAPERRAPAPRLRRRAEAPRVQLTARDRAIFCALARHRFLTAEQLRRLVFTTGQSRRVRAVLRRLYDVGLLDRVGTVAQPTAGVPPFLYQLTADSAAIAAAELGQPIGPPAASDPSLRFLAHHVGVCEFFIKLSEALRTTPWTIGEWQHEWQLRVPDEAGTRRAERVHVTDPDTRREITATVLPDAYFTLLRPGATRHFFFELDRGTHRRRRWHERALGFTAYARQGQFRQRFSGERFQLLVVTAAGSQRVSRADKIVHIMEQAVGASELFLVTAMGELTAEGFWSPVWRQPGSVGRHAMLAAATRADRVTVRPGAATALTVAPRSGQGQ